MIRLLLLLAFAVELPYDRYMLPLREVSWRARTLIMTISVVIVYWFYFPYYTGVSLQSFVIITWGELAGYYALAIAPYCFFDPALSVWRLGWRKWHSFSSEKKYWDRFFSNIQDMIGKWWLLFLRAVVCGLLIWLGL